MLFRHVLYHLSYRAMAGPLGFEPRSSGLEPDILPLNYRPMAEAVGFEPTGRCRLACFQDRGRTVRQRLHSSVARESNPLFPAYEAGVIYPFHSPARADTRIRTRISCLQGSRTAVVRYRLIENCNTDSPVQTPGLRHTAPQKKSPKDFIDCWIVVFCALIMKIVDF